MSEDERFTQVAYHKWAKVGELFRSLTKNERMSESLILLSESLIHSYFSKKQVISSEFRIPNPVSNICAEQASGSKNTTIGGMV